MNNQNILNMPIIERIDTTEFKFQESFKDVCYSKVNIFQLIVLTVLIISIFEEITWLILSSAIVETILYMGNLYSNTKQGKGMNKIISTLNDIGSLQKTMYKTQTSMYKQMLCNDIVNIVRNRRDNVNLLPIDYYQLTLLSLDDLEILKQELGQCDDNNSLVQVIKKWLP